MRALAIPVSEAERMHTLRNLLILDTALGPRFADNPMVMGDPGIRFYAGCPLVMASGQAVGALCLIGRTARRLDEWERGHLGTLAKMVAAELQGLSTSTIENRPNIPGYYG